MKLTTVTIMVLACPTIVTAQTETQVELQRIGAPPPLNGDEFHNFAVGATIASWGSLFAISDPAAASGGEVYVYRRTVGGWKFEQKLNAIATRGFGGGLAVHGNTIAVGDNLWGGSEDNLGRVFIFEQADAHWRMSQVIDAEGLESGQDAAFGASVALTEQTLVVGAPGVDHPIINGGELRIYDCIAGSWQPAARLRLPPTDDVHNFVYRGLGASVAISGTTIVAGAPDRYGAVCVFERLGSAWHRVAILNNPSPDIGDFFGVAVAMHGETIAVGAPASYSGSNPRPGRAYLYERDASGDWSLAREVRASDGYADDDHGDEFGRALDLQEGRLIVGANNGRFNGLGTGTVYVFERGANGWPSTENRRLIASDSSGDSDFLGWSVAAEGDYVFAGALGGWHDGIREGKAYVLTHELGESYCETIGPSAALAITGSPFVKDERITLTIRDSPAHAQGLFLLSPNFGSYPYGNDFLCLGAPVARIAYVQAGSDGIVLHDINFSAPWVQRKLLAGTTWYFQFAHELDAGSGNLDLLSNTISVMLK